MDEMYKNDFEEICENPIIKESLNPDSLCSFLHKVTECNKMSVYVLRMQKDYLDIAAHHSSSDQTFSCRYVVAEI